MDISTRKRIGIEECVEEISELISCLEQRLGMEEMAEMVERVKKYLALSEIANEIGAPKYNITGDLILKKLAAFDAEEEKSLLEEHLSFSKEDFKEGKKRLIEQRNRLIVLNEFEDEEIEVYCNILGRVINSLSLGIEAIKRPNCYFPIWRRN